MATLRSVGADISNTNLQMVVDTAQTYATITIPFYCLFVGKIEEDDKEKKLIFSLLDANNESNKLAVSETKASELKGAESSFASLYRVSLDFTFNCITLVGLAKKTLELKVQVQYDGQENIITATNNILIDLYARPSGIVFTSEAIKQWDSDNSGYIMNDTENLQFKFSGKALYAGDNPFYESVVTQLTVTFSTAAGVVLKQNHITDLTAGTIFSIDQAFYHNALQTPTSYMMTCSYETTPNVYNQHTYTLIYNGTGASIYSIEALLQDTYTLYFSSIQGNSLYGYNELTLSGSIVPKDMAQVTTFALEIFRTEKESINTATDFLVEFPIDITQEKYVYKDILPEAGIQYTYGARLIGYNNGQVYKELHTTNIRIATANALFFEDILLMTKDQILKFRYNTEVSTFKYTIADSITPTLGGTYPFVRRNGKQRYRTFSLKGLISLAQENDDTCYNISDTSSYLLGPLLYGINTTTPVTKGAEKCQKIIANQELSAYEKAILLERQYRDLVNDFLYKPTIKLFKSAQEGNIFIYLNNISLTPEPKLGRLVYSISCQCTEVEPTTMDTYRKFLMPDKSVTHTWSSYILPVQGVDATTGLYIINDSDITDQALEIEQANYSWTI